jgi:uncharacterized membrane protein YqjE
MASAEPQPAAQDSAAELRELSTAELLRRLAQETGQLVRGELELARAETRERLGALSRAGAAFAAAAVAALLALGALTAAVIVALDGAMTLWLAALIPALVWATVAAIAAATGRTRMKETGTPVPQDTINDMKEDLAWVQDRARS